jgi:hypothetical protein
MIYLGLLAPAAGSICIFDICEADVVGIPAPFVGNIQALHLTGTMILSSCLHRSTLSLLVVVLSLYLVDVVYSALCLIVSW